MNLPNQQNHKIQSALIDAFPDRASLDRMVWYEFNKKLDEIAPETNLEAAIVKLIETAEAENWTKDLVAGALDSNPTNQSLKELAGDILL